MEQARALPGGRLRPFNIDAKLNGAYVALGLLYGKGDFVETLRISTRCGQDSDCNPASAVGVLGVVLGYKGIPDEWKSGIPPLGDQKFRHTDYSFRGISLVTEKLALQMIKQNGGRQEGDVVLIKPQSPKPARLELWDDYGSPVERISTTDSRWAWKGAWTDTPNKIRQRAVTTKTSSAKGAEASIQFEGTGAIITGPYLPSGGKAEVYVDGKLDRTVDVYSDEENQKYGESVWHAFGLERHEAHSAVGSARGAVRRI